MAIANFVPEVWAAGVQDDLQAQAVLGPICAASYTGPAELKGNAVNVTGVVPPTITDYSATRTTDPEASSDQGFKLNIDEEWAFDFLVDDIDKAQAAGGFEKWTEATGRSLAFNADQAILAKAKANGTAANLLEDVTDPASAFNAIRDMRKQLSKANVPTSQRYLAINAEFEALLLDSSAKFTDASVFGTDEALRNGVLGGLLGFVVVTSEAFAEADVPSACAFWKPALPFVEQITEVEAMRANSKFADRIRGLHVFGTDVVDFYADAVVFYEYEEPAGP